MIFVAESRQERGFVRPIPTPAASYEETAKGLLVLALCGQQRNQADPKRLDIFRATLRSAIYTEKRRIDERI
jgi:hypothetical protein